MKKNKKVLKVVTAVTSLAVVSAISFGATMAFLTARTNQRTNTFTSGGIQITLEEPNWEETNAKYSPGQDVPKDPKVKTDSAESTFVALTIQYWTKDSGGSWTQISETDFDGIATLQKSQPGGGFVNGLNDGWVDGGTIGSETYVYYWADAGVPAPTFKELASDAETDSIFDNVSFKKTLEKSNMPDIKIIVTAYAVRADSYKTGGTVNNENVKSSLDNLIKTHAPTTAPTD